MTKGKATGFSMFIDKETEELLNKMVQSFLIDIQEGRVKIPDDKKMETRETLLAFLETLSKHVHELGWCEDPDCPVKNGK